MHVNLQLKIELIMNELKVTFYLKKNETNRNINGVKFNREVRRIIGHAN